ncbi:CRISPR-associated endonuclease Cas1 [Candidatus Harpocratesius sp.]
MIIVVQEPGTRLGKTSEQLKIIRSNGEFKVAFRLVESIICLTKCYISYDVNIACARYGIPVFYMRKGHPIMATLPYAHHGFVITRKAQFDSYSNGKGMLLMTSITLGAITNKIRMIKYLSRNIKRKDLQKAQDFQDKASKMELLRKEVKKIEIGIKSWYFPVKTKQQQQIVISEKNEMENVKDTIPDEGKNISIDQSQNSDTNQKKNNNTNQNINSGSNQNTNSNSNQYINQPNHPNQQSQPNQQNQLNQKNLKKGGLNLNPNHLRAKLMGYEGSVSRIYFSLLKDVFPSSLNFTKRVRRPPRDPINASISFGNHLLANEIMVAIVVAGLEPFAGFMHSDRSGRPSLVFDLMEEFRQPLVDRLILRLFRKRILQNKHFTDEGDEFGMRFKKSGMEIFLREFYYLVRKQGEYIKGTFMTYQNLMLNQARLMVRYFLGKVKSYKPFLMKW